ncbi:hypothetical protein SAMN06265338_11316 [Rhodoblastus acidophilus]|uniref:Uncharacterized protein n=1 Tax=Rhodoblastus acidophilus TaxID=1074 RepID=A0A212S5G2_RHOAC|nr:hypothetical protein [Rhodoblastus acidophilus]PPQ37516.1 hypothetical protein CKO16_14155 [Rhodoblastus acidophilus]RAI19666.1 hypothetical protein CH337_11560 [Rhodoblastus acidophilus]SNB80419.1 hypothetical protein SAMN06265338_11316 [Rhodoblastus acidophilus]
MTFIANVARNAGDPKILDAGQSSLGAVDRLAKALGWFSIALGLTELFAARRLSRVLGLNGHGLVRLYGVRELAAGVATLSVDKQAGLWSRVGGDALDIATLMAARGRDNPRRDTVGLALALVLGVTVLDVAATQVLAARANRKRRDPRPSYRDRSGFPRGLRAARDGVSDVRSPKRGGADPVTTAAQ